MLVCEKPFKWQGRDLARGDAVDPAPQGRVLYALLDQRKIAYADGRPSHKDEHPVTFIPSVCDVEGCGFQAVSERALDNHIQAVHSVASIPPVDAAPVSVSPGAPEPADAEPSLASAGALACPDCSDGKVFKSAQGLKVHRSRAHAGA